MAKKNEDISEQLQAAYDAIRLEGASNADRCAVTDLLHGTTMRDQMTVEEAEQCREQIDAYRRSPKYG